MTKLSKKDLKKLFKPAKSQRIADAVTIKSPTAFKQSIRKLKQGRYTLHEQKALQLAKNRAQLQLKRENLSAKERKQFKAITKVKIPKAKTKKR